MQTVDALVEQKKKDLRIQLMVLGGSAARGDETEHSDIDINFFVRKKDMPDPSRRFYLFEGRFIEETFLPVEDFKIKELPAEVKILFDRNNFSLKRKQLSEKQKFQQFKKDWKEAKKYLRLAEGFYKQENYDKAVLYLLGTKSLVSILVHSLPLRFDLPFPSFRLLKSIKLASNTLGDEKIYYDCINLFKIKNLDVNKILADYNRAYKIMAKCYSNKYPLEKNLGFYDNLKIKYNDKGLRLTFEDYPPEFALRFIISCVVDWSLDSEQLWSIKKNKCYKTNVSKLTYSVLGITRFDKEFATEKLLLSKNLEKGIDNLLFKISKEKI
jgi:predicted nucleotidyltransferase